MFGDKSSRSSVNQVDEERERFIAMKRYRLSRPSQIILVCLFIAVLGCRKSSVGNSLVKMLIEPPTSVSQYDRFQLIFGLPNAKGNPFNPKEIDVNLTINLPSGKVVTHLRSSKKTTAL